MFKNKFVQAISSFFFLVFFLLVLSSNVFSYTVIENQIEDKIHSDLRALVNNAQLLDYEGNEQAICLN